MSGGRHFQSKRSYFGEDTSAGGHEVKMFGNSTGKYARWNSTDDQWEVVGNSSFNGNVDINGELTVAESVVLSSNVGVTGALEVTANSSFLGTLTVAKTLTASSNAAITGALEVTGNSSFKGTLTVTGALTVNGGITSTNALTINVEYLSTNETILLNHGVSHLWSTEGGARTYTLADPEIGILKFLCCSELASTGTDTVVVNVSTNVHIGFDTTNTQIIFTNPDTAVTLVGLSSVAWLVVNNNGATIGHRAT